MLIVFLEYQYFQERRAKKLAIPQDVDKLTEAFVKGDNARTNRYGSGVGMAIIKNLLLVSLAQFK